MNKKLLFLLFFGVLLGALDIAILGPALPSIQQFFDASHRQLSWIINVYMLAFLISTTLLSKLSDLYGRRSMYILSLSIFAAGSLTIVFAKEFNILLLGRGIQGFGAGGLLPVASAIIGDTVPKSKQGSALGLLGSVFGLALIIGPTIGGFLLLIHWHWIFIINIPISLVLIIATIKEIPLKQKIKGRIIFDWMGMTILLGILTLFILSITEIDSTNIFDSISSSKVLPYFIAALVLFPVFIYSQHKSPAPTLDPQLFKSKQLVLAYLIALGAGLSEVAVIFIPGYAKTNYELSDSTASFALLPLMFALFVGSPITGILLDRIGARVTLLSGALLNCIGWLGFAFVSSHIAWFYVSEVLMGLGLSSIIGSPLHYIINHETLPKQRALGQGIVSVFRRIGLLLSAALTGALIASHGDSIEGYINAFKILAFISILMVLSSLGLKKQ
jgi:MFS family permease